MADLEPPNLGEVLRRLDNLSTQLTALVAEMKADRAENARIYVRADVYNVAQTAQNAIVADLHRDVGQLETNLRAEITSARSNADAKFAVIETDRKADMAWRRQVLLGLGTLAVTVLLAIVGFVITLTR